MVTGHTAALRARLCQEASRAQIMLSVEQVDQLIAFVELLVHWAKRIRIVGTADPLTLIERHIVDAFWLVTALDGEHGLRGLTGLDVGAGAGLPGLPVAILQPRFQLTLIEPRQRRCAFLRRAVSALGLKVTIEEARLEEGQRDPVDVAWSRATWSPAQWLKRSLTVTVAEGRSVVFLARAEQLPTAASAVVHRTVPYTLRDGTPRTIVIYTKDLTPALEQAA